MKPNKYIGVRYVPKFLDENGLDKVFSIIKTNVLAKITEV